MKTKEIQTVTHGMPASDGAGVKMTRMIGSPNLPDLDPFLMLDVFETENPNDYIAGFPPHPHRGFETVTYMLKGHMRHQDSMGNNGVLKPGGVQWMTAGRGVIHSEMPEQVEGAMQGFQLWVNLPSYAKMIEPDYQDFDPEEIPVESDKGRQIRVITGKTEQGTVGAVENDYVHPTYLDVDLADSKTFEQTVGDNDNTFIFVINGQLSIGDLNRTLDVRQLAVLTKGDKVSVKANGDTRFILVSGEPIGEPIAKGGPFVMNTQDEVRQAFADFRNNRF